MRHAFNGAYSFGKSKRSSMISKEAVLVPSAFNYRPKTADRPRSLTCKIGTSKRKFIGSNLDIPSVGKYTIAPTKKTKGITMAVKYRPHQPNNTPGPGAYPIHNPLRQQSAGLAYREPHQWAKLGVPGPAEYDLCEMRKTSPIKRGNFGSGDRNSIYKTQPKNNPAPDSYKPRPFTASPKIGFGTSTRESYYFQEDIPGPDRYFTVTVSPKFKKGFTIASKYKSPQPNGTPGPGAYDALIKRSKQSCIMGVSNKTDFVDPDAKNKPGPGQYTYGSFLSGRKSHQKGSTFYQGKRSTINTITDTPGPGHYIETYSSLGGSKAKMIFLKKTDKKFYTINDVPGPGAYDLSQNTSVTQYTGEEFSLQYGLSTSIRPTQVRNRFYSVGPGSYDVLKHPSSKKGKRSEPLNKTIDRPHPGPGYYNISGELGEMPKYLRPRTTNPEQSDMVSKLGSTTPLLTNDQAF